MMTDIVSEALEHLDSLYQRGVAFTSPNKAGEFFCLRMAQYEHEVFAVAFLDNKHKLISIDDMFRGTLDGASVYPREVVKAALNHNAAAVIFAHNHPSGEPEPSSADQALTKRLKSALALIDIRAIDHFVIGGGKYVSLSERGLM